MSRRKPKDLAECAQAYAEQVVKRVGEKITTPAEMKLELVLAYMCGSMRAKENAAHPQEIPL